MQNVSLFSRFPGAFAENAEIDQIAVEPFRNSRNDDPFLFKPSNELIDAINASILLGLPLLITGETGVGKTSVGRSVAAKLKLPLLEFTVKSTSKASDLFYEYDAIRRFHAVAALNAGLATAQEQKTDPAGRIEFLRYIKVRALGRAILNASDYDRAKLLLSDEEDHKPRGSAFGINPISQRKEWYEKTDWPACPTQSVVIIDEIDKASADFCNDLLDEIDQMRFQVPELSSYSLDPDSQTEGDAPRFGGDDLLPTLRPIVFITSNEIRKLPDAFVRRCCFHHMSMPTGKDLDRILEARISSLSMIETPLRETLLGFFRKLREDSSIRKTPGLAELLGWLRLFSSIELGNSLEDQHNAVSSSFTALLKNQDDLHRAQNILKHYWQKPIV